jgi:hypothetical protein
MLGSNQCGILLEADGIESVKIDLLEGVWRSLGSGKDKGVVMVNGTRVTVDVEELPEQEIKALAKRKRTKPIRIPLDQPPVVGVIRRRRAEWDADSDVPNSSDSTPRNVSPELPEPAKLTPVSTWLTSPKITSPRTKCCPSTIE